MCLKGGAINVTSTGTAAREKFSEHKLGVA